MYQISRNMAEQDERHTIVELRLRSWLSTDEKGIRHAVIGILLSQGDLTIQDIYDQLSGSFPISYHSVAGMIGIISSRIGILTGTRDLARGCRLYTLRAKHVPVVRRILSL
jgi:hypothetical protein